MYTKVVKPTNTTHTLIDSYYNNQGTWTVVYSGTPGVGQSFTGNGYYLDSVVFNLIKSGSPTGTAKAKIYNSIGNYGSPSTDGSIPTGNALATSNPLDVSTLSNSVLQLTTFTFPTSILLTTGTHYVVTCEYTGGDGSNLVGIGYDQSSPTASGNYSSKSSGFWNANGSYALYFYVYGNIPYSPILKPTGTNYSKISKPSITNTNNSLLIDSYSESNADLYFSVRNDSQKAKGQSFTALDYILESAKFYLYKIGSPTGNCYAKIYAHSGIWGSSGVPNGSVLATSDAYDISTFPTTKALLTFTFSGVNRISLVNGAHYVIVFDLTGTNSDVSNSAVIGIDNSSPSAAGNLSSYTSSWSATSTQDLCFYVYGIVNPSYTNIAKPTVTTASHSSLKSPNTIVNDTSTGNIAWVNPDNAKVSDDVYTTVQLTTSPYISNWLKATNFRFSLPRDAQITDIMVEIQAKTSLNSWILDYVRIVKRGVIKTITGTPLSYGTNEIYHSINSSWLKIGETWTAADINDSGFGVAISTYGDASTTSYIISIDHIRITVYYNSSKYSTVSKPTNSSYTKIAKPK